MNAELLRALARQVEDVHLPSSFSTWWRIFSFNEKTGIVKKVVAQPNLIPYQGADVLAKALSGNVDFKVAAVLKHTESDPDIIAWLSVEDARGLLRIKETECSILAGDQLKH